MMMSKRSLNPGQGLQLETSYWYAAGKCRNSEFQDLRVDSRSTILSTVATLDYDFEHYWCLCFFCTALENSRAFRRHQVRGSEQKRSRKSEPLALPSHVINTRLTGRIH
eukprot:68202-Rhodomonas_salina.1